ncbi:hypothetical protein BDP27DRAFT_1337331 [Rhodocollybia butyracea]|uniref:Ubiquitin-like domain-containing protein n=1 Tax=Rhodocollybia butyracea TaxID=206335 RepID=A0A9P5PH08_9AGAR|nr:hypothetical protein BDP27DRAFT_1337331 [Rhodocollybia butyracea]
MPKDTTKSKAKRSRGKKRAKKDKPLQASPARERTGRIIFMYNTRQMALPKSLLESHVKTTKLVRETFELNNDVKIIFETADLPECENGISIEVPPAAWTHLLPLVIRISVVTREAPQNPVPVSAPALPSGPLAVPLSSTATTSTPKQEPIPFPVPLPAPTPSTPIPSTQINLTLSYASKFATVTIPRNVKVRTLKKAFTKSFGRNLQGIRFRYNGSLIDFNKTPTEISMRDGDVIDVLEAGAFGLEAFEALRIE